MKGQLRVMFPLGAKASPGDQVVEWDTEVQETVDRAAATFAQLLLSGHVGFATAGGQTDRRLEEFDPTAERIVMTMPMVGG